MASFTNLADLQRYLQKNIVEIASRSADIERVVAEEISQAVVDVVYAAYTPEQYDRRMDDGGLSDTRNIFITDFGIKDGKVFVTFENLTEGEDNLQGQFTGDLIEFGDGYGNKYWNNPDGTWSDPRPFMEEAAKRLNDNPQELVDAMKKGLAERGFKFK